MSGERGESFGGPPDVQVTRHPRGAGPLVRLKHDPSCTGRVLRQGPSQSIVKWQNGNEDCVVNTWIERIEETTLRREESHLAKPKGTGADKGSNSREADSLGVPVRSRDALSSHPSVAAPKLRKEPDALARRVSEFDDQEMRNFAVRNGCWDDKYMTLPNIGLRRMNIMNRLRARLRREPEYQVKW